MKHRDRVTAALDHKLTDRPPFQATFCPEFADRLRKEFHLPARQTEPHHRQWYGYDLEILTGQDILQAGVGWFTNYYLKNVPYTDDWGVKWRVDEYKTPMGTGIYTNIEKNPLKDNGIEVRNYKAPDPNNPDLYYHVEKLIREFRNEYYIIGRVHCTIFESAWALRGMDTLMLDFYLNPEIAEQILDITYKYHLEVSKNMAGRGVDMIWLGDDVGGQSGLMIDPDLWRRLFKPKMAKIICEVKAIKPDIKIAYHSDGCVYDIITDIIDIGIDVLNPIQIESMNPDFLQKKYGDKICFFGGVGVQSTLPRGTEEDIKNEVSLLKKTLGKNGNWICAPTHHVQLDTPMKNFFTLLKEIGIKDMRYQLL